MNKEEPSLLQHLTESRKKQCPEEGVSMVIFAGKIKSESDLNEVLGVHRKIVEDCVNSNECTITGMLMGQGNSVLHLIEGPCFSILSILRSLSAHPHFANDIQTGRIIYNIEDRPRRFYPEWYSCIIQERRSQVDDVTAETCKDLVHELAQNMLRVGKGLEVDHSRGGGVELGKYSELLPGRNLLVSMAGCTLFFSLQDFVGFYADPYHVELETERTWPLQAIVRY